MSFYDKKRVIDLNAFKTNTKNITYINIYLYVNIFFCTANNLVSSSFDTQIRSMLYFMRGTRKHEISDWCELLS